MTTSYTPLSPTPRSTPRRRDRTRTDRRELYRLLDDAIVGHLAVCIDGAPLVLPTIFGRNGDSVYIHGSSAARSLREGSAPGAAVCFTVTHLDGVVFARAAAHHSMNFRSAVIHGHARAVTGREQKLAALETIVEHVTPGLWTHSRPPTKKELAQTQVLELDTSEASVRVRQGPPADDLADVEADDYWAGVVPMRPVFGPAEPSPDLRRHRAAPAYINSWSQNKSRVIC
ncbi:pyridoxamine 5'-phosphate oxidase family protein [Hoyosella sp. YIM 151337]|uniref:pyridoxamine 5'-phosphate oxidase family protein n=1 Tax=Hoyosella sp. YIM 151337 TaxID=2992742 RepID=UPI0022356845|nr:pyridoxamine 5'-phosphate oxidase family protein [Hoyosella sp. YIM 151337]MCW4351853.1 pyridoxamine 5'-phosphate oxidase family protein [Hoyosella sp. YIM 151337]